MFSKITLAGFCLCYYASLGFWGDDNSPHFWILLIFPFISISIALQIGRDAERKKKQCNENTSPVSMGRN